MNKAQKMMGTKKTGKNNALIGYVVLGLGVIVLMVVFYMMYQKFNPQGGGGVQETQSALNRALGEEPKVTYKRQKVISEGEVRNKWETYLKKDRALLEMKKGQYQLIIIGAGKNSIRYYSKGDYTLKGDLILMKPDLTRSPPRGKGTYKVLTRSKMPVMALMHNGKLVWQAPPFGAGVYVPPYHPVLNRVKNKIVVWSVLE